MIDALIDIARAAGDEILAVYDGAFDVQAKADNTPLTEADLRAHRVIADGLRALDPDLPLISEESTPPPFAERRRWRRHWLVDPLDGTKEFVNRNGEFTVNIALIEDGVTVLGVVGVPVRGTFYVGDLRQGLAYRLDGRDRVPLHARAMRDGRLAVVASRRHGGGRLAAYLNTLRERFAEVTKVSVGSSLKLCLLAEGEADLYPRLAPTSQWDTAAADAVLTAAGGKVLRSDGETLSYDARESFLNPDFLAVADPRFPWAEHLPRTR